jgi:hypothetical protein
MPAGEMELMSEALKHIGELRLHQPDLADLHYLAQLNSAQGISMSGASMSSWAFNIAGAAFIVSFVVLLGCFCVCTCRHCCHRSTPPPAATSTILRAPPRSPSQARLGAGRPRWSPHLASRFLPGCMKGAEEPEPVISYHTADEEVQLRSPTDDLPEIYQEAEFAVNRPAAVPPPQHYSTLPRTRRPSHGELSRRLSALSN